MKQKYKVLSAKKIYHKQVENAYGKIEIRVREGKTVIINRNIMAESKAEIAEILKKELKCDDVYLNVKYKPQK